MQRLVHGIRQLLNRFGERVGALSPRLHLLLALVLGALAFTVPVRETEWRGFGTYGYLHVEQLPERELLVALLLGLALMLWLRDVLPNPTEFIFWALVFLIPFVLFLPVQFRWDRGWTPLQRESERERPAPRWRCIVISLLFLGLFFGLYQLDARRLLPWAESKPVIDFDSVMAMIFLGLWFLSTLFKGEPERVTEEERMGEGRLTLLFMGGHRWFHPWWGK
jgi:hypothetical protein